MLPLVILFAPVLPLSAADGAAYDEGARDEDEVLYHELPFRGKQERVKVLEGDLGLDDEDEEGTGHLHDEEDEGQAQGHAPRPYTVLATRS